MSLILIIFLILVGLLILFLTPRLSIRGEFSHERAFIELFWIWISFKADLREHTTVARVLFFRKKLFGAKDKGSHEDNADRGGPAEKKTSRDTAPDEAGESDIQEDAASGNKAEPSRKPSKSFSVRIGSRKKKKSRKRRKKSADKDGMFVLRMLWQEKLLIKRVLGRMIKGFIRVLRTARIDYFRSSVEFGAGDPMTTGIIYGAATPLFMLNLHQTRISLTPHFEDEIFDFTGACSLSVIPLYAILVSFYQFLSLPWFSMIRTSLRIRRDWRSI